MVVCARRLLLASVFTLAMLTASLVAAAGLGAVALAAEAGVYRPSSVVRELPEKRTAASDTYLLGDGTCARSSTMSRCATVMRPAPGGRSTPASCPRACRRPNSTGSAARRPQRHYRSAATPMQVTLASEAEGRAPVTVAYDGAEVSFDLRGAAEQAKLIAGDRATYIDALAEVSLSYRVIAKGLKEEITLASKAAPGSYTYFVRHGASAALRPDRPWGFYRRGESSRCWCLDPVLAYDSSRDAPMIPPSRRRAMTVRPALGGASSPTVCRAPGSTMRPASGR